jgi:hypothetical protein
MPSMSERLQFVAGDGTWRTLRLPPGRLRLSHDHLWLLTRSGPTLIAVFLQHSTGPEFEDGWRVVWKEDGFTHDDLRQRWQVWEDVHFIDSKGDA